MRREEWEAAIARATAFITEKATNGATEVRIYTWHNDPKDARRLRSIGLRVAEVSFWMPAPNSTKRRPIGAGASYMQVDVPWGACICLLTERLILAYAERWPEDEIAEEEERLEYALRQE